MDERTASFYSQHAAEIAPRYDAVQPLPIQLAGRLFDAGMRVLDVGCGSGRDVAQLLALGCDAYGVEPTAAFRQSAAIHHPELAGRLAEAALPQLGQPFGGAFDGVLCSAVLMHLPQAEIPTAAGSLRSILQDNGRLILSVPLNRPGLDEQHRDGVGRLFTPLSPGYLQPLFARAGFHLLEQWETQDAQGRAGHSWYTFVFGPYP